MSFMVWSITGTALAACSGPIFGDGTSIGGGGGRSGGSGVFTISESSSGPTSIAAQLGSVPADGGVYISPAAVHRPQPQAGPEGADIQTGPGGVDIQDAVIMFRPEGGNEDGSDDIDLATASASHENLLGVPIGEDIPTGFLGATPMDDSGETFYYVSQANLERLFLSFDDPTYQVDADFDINLHVYDSANEMFALDETTARTVPVRFNADVDDPATAIALVGGAQDVTSIMEADGISRTKIADLMIVDIDETPLNTLQIVVTDNSLSPADAARIVALFELGSTTDGTAIYLREGTNLDFETLTSLPIRVQLVADSTIGVNISVAVTDVNDVAPMITSGATGGALVEGTEIPANTQVVYAAAGDFDVTPIVWSLAEDIGDEGALSINSTTGAVTFDADTTPNHGIKSTYTFTVVATSGSLTPARQSVTINVSNIPSEDPVITSRATGAALPENTEVGTGTAVYTATGTPELDTSSIIWSLAANIGDENDLSIDGATGVVTFDADTTPNHETKDTYSFTVIATDSLDSTLTSNLAVTIAVTDVDERATGIALETGSTPMTIPEADNIPQTKIADLMFTGDPDGGDSGTLELAVANRNMFEIVGTDLFLRAGTDLDFEDVPAFTVRVQLQEDTDVFLNVPVTVTDANDVAPMITSGATGDALVEGVLIPIMQVVYAAAGDFDVTPIVWSLEGDQTLFTINDTTGAVTFVAPTIPDHETQDTYTFTVVATSGSLTPARQSVTIDVPNILNEVPVITSGATGTALLENSPVAVGTVVYTATGTTELSTSSIMWSLEAGTGDQRSFTIDGTTGAVTFAATTATTPDHEDQDRYSFTVIATDSADDTLISRLGVSIAVTDANDAPTGITTSTTGALTVAYSDPALVTDALMITTLSTTDPDDPDGTGTYTYSTGGMHGDEFDIRNGNELWLLPNPPSTVASGGDFEITITTEDSGDLRYSQDFTISRGNSPTLSANLTGDNDVTEDDTGDATASGTLTFDDADTGQDKSNLEVYVAAGTTATNASTRVATGATNLTVEGTYGEFALTRTNAGDVTWTYTLDQTDADTQALRHGQQVTDQLAVIVYDADVIGSGVEVITIDVTGANDAPVLGDPTGATVTDSGDSETDSTVTGSLTGTFTETDVDTGDTHTFSARGHNSAMGVPVTDPMSSFTHSVNGRYGMLFYDSGTGEYEYVRDEVAIATVNAGNPETDSFAITVTDDSGDTNAAPAAKNLVFTINGANDAPTSSITSGAATADVSKNEAGTLDIADLGFTDIDANVPNSDLTIRAFASGADTEPPTPLYEASTPTPINTVGGPSSGGGIDNTVTGTYGTFTINRINQLERINLFQLEGRLRITYDLDEVNNTDVMNLSGGNLYEKLTIYVNDGDETAVAQTFVVRVVDGSVPTVSLGRITDGRGIVTEDRADDETYGRELTFDDADDGQDISNLQVYVAAGQDVSNASTEVELGTVGTDFEVSVEGTYGSLVITRESTGEVSWLYTLDHTDEDTQALNHDAQEPEFFAFIVYDDTGLKSSIQSTSIGVKGRNDRPTLDPVTGATITDNAASAEDSTVTTGSLTGMFTVTDVDIGNPHTFSASFGGTGGTALGASERGFSHSIVGDYGTLFYNGMSVSDTIKAAAYEYVRDEADINALNDGSTMTDTFEIIVTDGRNIAAGVNRSGSDPRDLVFTIIGANEAALSQAPAQQQPQQGVELYSDDMSGGPSDDIPPQNPELI